MFHRYFSPAGPMNPLVGRAPRLGCPSSKDYWTNRSNRLAASVIDPSSSSSSNLDCIGCRSAGGLLPCPVQDLRRQNRKIGEFCEVIDSWHETHTCLSQGKTTHHSGWSCTSVAKTIACTSRNVSDGGEEGHVSDQQIHARASREWDRQQCDARGLEVRERRRE